MEKARLDVYMHENTLAESREKAKQLIINGSVYVNNKLITKPSFKVSDCDNIKVINNFEYVGRGASKLEKAIKFFNIKVDQAISVDIGASTGGFTDYLLKNNASKVYAIDVGHNQLHESLRRNEKVINLEDINFRYMDTSIIKDKIDIITVDVSFISLKLILPKIVEISHKDTDIILLIKPQFEAGKQKIGKNGIVKDKNVHLEVLNNFKIYCENNGLFINNLTYSPVKGGDGNIEYLAHIKSTYSSDTNPKEINFKNLIKETFEYYK